MPKPRATVIEFEPTDCAELNVTHVRTGTRFFWVPDTGLLREFGRSPAHGVHCATKGDVIVHIIARCAAFH